MASYTYQLIELGDEAHGLGCKCCRFNKGLDLPSPRKDLSKADARELAVGFATSVFKDFTRLNAILKRFEGESSAGHRNPRRTGMLTRSRHHPEAMGEERTQAAQRAATQGVSGDAHLPSS